MSNLTLKGNASGSGTFIVESPNSNTSRTITLPDATGTLATTTDSITQTQLETAFNVSGSAPMFACRAWVVFDGRGTVSIKASGNVSSITDNGTGDYTVNFTTAMPDANYCATGNVLTNTTGAVQGAWVIQGTGAAGSTTPALKSTTQLRILAGLPNSTGAADMNDISVAIFR